MNYKPRSNSSTQLIFKSIDWTPSTTNLISTTHRSHSTHLGHCDARIGLHRIEKGQLSNESVVNIEFSIFEVQIPKSMPTTHQYSNPWIYFSNPSSILFANPMNFRKSKSGCFRNFIWSANTCGKEIVGGTTSVWKSLLPPGICVACRGLTPWLVSGDHGRFTCDISRAQKTSTFFL